MRIAREYVIQGRVQGVGFRVFVMRSAQQLNVKGWVRNEADGSVRARAEGTPDAIRAFEALLEQGPPGARVERVLQREVTPSYRPNFEILP